MKVLSTHCNANNLFVKEYYVFVVMILHVLDTQVCRL